MYVYAFEPLLDWNGTRKTVHLCANEAIALNKRVQSVFKAAGNSNDLLYSE